MILRAHQAHSKESLAAKRAQFDQADAAVFLFSPELLPLECILFIWVQCTPNKTSTKLQ